MPAPALLPTAPVWVRLNSLRVNGDEHSPGECARAFETGRALGMLHQVHERGRLRAYQNEHDTTHKEEDEPLSLDAGAVSKGGRGWLVRGPKGRASGRGRLLHGPQPVASQLRMEAARAAWCALDKRSGRSPGRTTSKWETTGFRRRMSGSYVAISTSSRTTCSRVPTWHCSSRYLTKPMQAIAGGSCRATHTIGSPSTGS